MSRGTGGNYSWTPLENRRQAGWPAEYSNNNYGANASNYSTPDSSRTQPRFGSRPPLSFNTVPVTDGRRHSMDPSWPPPGERVMTRPGSFTGFPERSRSSVQVVVVENGATARQIINPRRQMSFSGPLPALRQGAAEEQAEYSHSRTSDLSDEQTKALNKLKKEIYNPTSNKVLRRLSLYYRDNARISNSINSSNEKEDEDGKRCAVCLEDFEPKEMVMLTPCNHMFHEDCIVPWVKSHGQCPVCRFVICERIKQIATASSNNNNTNVVFPDITANDLFAGELISIIRAMEEAFLWNHAH